MSCHGSVGGRTAQGPTALLEGAGLWGCALGGVLARRLEPAPLEDHTPALEPLRGSRPALNSNLASLCQQHFPATLSDSLTAGSLFFWGAFMVLMRFSCIPSWLGL